MRTLEEELYYMGIERAREMLSLFRYDESSVLYILRNLHPRVAEAVIYGEYARA